MNDVVDSCLKIVLFIYFCLEAFFMMFVPKWLRYKDVKGEIVLITGGGGDLGRQLALKFAALGCRVVIWGVDEKENRETVKKVTKRGGECCSYVCDVTKREMVYQTAKKVKDEIGHVNILVNNAGIVTGNRILDCPDHLIEKTFKANALSHFWTCKSFLPYMMARNRGHIVTIASLAGLIGVPNLTDYCASKFATVGFSESLLLELKKEAFDGIKTTLVCPAVVNTGSFSESMTEYISLLRVENVAEEIISAVLTNEEFVTVPRLLKATVAFKYIFPFRASIELFRAFKGEKIMKILADHSGKVKAIDYKT